MYFTQFVGGYHRYNFDKFRDTGTDFLTCLFDCCLCFAKSSSQLFDKKMDYCKFRYLNPGNSCLRNPESGKFSLVEYGILAFGIWNAAQGIWNPTNNWNPDPSDKNPESSSWSPNPRRGIQNLRLSWITLNVAAFFNACNLIVEKTK